MCGYKEQKENRSRFHYRGSSKGCQRAKLVRAGTGNDFEADTLNGRESI